MSAAHFVPRAQAAIRKRVRVLAKRAYQTVRWRSVERPRIVFVVGCQRSGTTLLLRLFDANRDCWVFSEHGALSSADPARVRLNPLPEVAASIGRVHAPLVVAKPLVETQNVRRLLDYFPGSTALFVFRSYADVVRSDLAKFGARNAINNLRPIVEGDPHNWRSEGASNHVRQLVADLFSPHMNPNDAAALFWFARNQLYFDLNLQGPSVMLVEYEDIVRAPSTLMRRIHGFLKTPCPELPASVQVYSTSVNAGAGLSFSPVVREACETLTGALKQRYAQDRLEHD